METHLKNFSLLWYTLTLKINSKDGDVLPVNFSDFFFHSVLVKRVSYSRELHVCCVQFFSRSFPFRLESMGCMLMHQTPWLVHACQSICTGTCCLRHMGLVSIVIELMKYSVWKVNVVFFLIPLKYYFVIEYSCILCKFAKTSVIFCRMDVKDKNFF